MSYLEEKGIRMCEPGPENETHAPSQIEKLREARTQSVDLILKHVGILADPRNMLGTGEWKATVANVLTSLVRAADFLDGEILIEEHRTVSMTK